jgi:hypothetical protein
MNDIQQIRFREQIAKAKYEIDMKKIKLYDMSKRTFNETPIPWYKWQLGQHLLRIEILEAEIGILNFDIVYLETQLSNL